MNAAVECRRFQLLPKIPVLISLWALFLLSVSLALGQERVPRWLTELPVEPGCRFAIGECGKYFDPKKGSEEARRVAAFRLAASISATIRFGLAADLEGGAGRHISFAEVSIDTSIMEKLLSEMILLDSVQLDDGVHLLVGCGTNPSLPAQFKKLVTPREDVPNWVLNPPSSKEALYGIGSSWKRGIAGWEEAERMARVSLAEQVSVEVKTGTWSYFGSAEGRDETLMIQAGNTTLHCSQVVARALDREGVSYVLVRMPLKNNIGLNPETK